MRHELQKIVQRQDLTSDEARHAMTEIMDGSATAAQIAGFAVAIRMKGETIDEIAAFASVMREYAAHVPVTTERVLVDTCGTGGDALNTFNISTTAAIVAASDGRVAVAKHGNRAASSKCGSADVLEALGVRLDLPPANIGACIETVGIGFLYAPAMHPALRYAAAPRREIGIRTFFNILGPLTNPAGAKVQLIGVFDLQLCEMLAKVLQVLGSERALLVHGANGLDEISTSGVTTISELKRGEVTTYSLDSERDLRIPLASLDDLAAGASPTDNAKIVRGILEGIDRGARRHIVCLNAAGVLTIARVVSDLNDGMRRAEFLIDSGAALATLEALKSFGA